MIQTTQQIASSQGNSLKVLIVGFSGAGKTTWAAKAPRPLLISTEKQGVMSALAVSPDIPVIPISNISEFWRAVNLISGAKTNTDEQGTFITIEGHRVETVIIDSIAEIERMLKDDVLKGTNKKVLEIQDWQILLDRMVKTFRWQRDLPVSTIVVALATTNYDSLQQRRVTVALSGKRMPHEIGQFFNAVGFAERDSDGEEVQYRITWRGDGMKPSKPAPCNREDGKLWPSRTQNATLGDLIEFVHPTPDGGTLVADSIEAGETKIEVRRGLRR